MVKNVRLHIARVLALAAVAAVAVAVPADAKQAAPMKASSTCGTCVAPITCILEDSCVLDFVGNGGHGYWRARQSNGSIWVRLTLVNGN